MPNRLRICVLAALMFFPVLNSPAQTSPTPMPSPAPMPVATLKVGVYDRPPLAMKNDDGEWVGLSVDLWERIAKRLNIQYQYVEVPLDETIQYLTSGQVDIVIGELGVTAERAKLIEFTQPYLYSPAAVATSAGERLSIWKQVVYDLTQRDLLLVVTLMMGTLFIFSIILWIVEKEVHHGHFGGKPIHGFGSALWFAAVTMTTVGYGDKTPQTATGRFLAFLWMFSGILLVSAFTGTVASSITVTRLNSGVSQISDLGHYKTGALAGSMSQQALTASGIPCKTYDTVESALEALHEQKIGAFLGNQVTIGYLMRTKYPGEFRLTVLPVAHVWFAFAMRQGSPFYQDINLGVVEETNRLSWAKDSEQWLGTAQK